MLGGPGLVCYKDLRASRPRACILLRTINAVLLSGLCSGNLMAAVVYIEGVGRMAIESAYFPYDSRSNPPKEVNKLVEYCTAKRLLLVLGCEANSQHLVWASSKTNLRRHDLMEYLVNTELDILKPGSTPTFRNAIREVFDITICSRIITDKVKRWRVSDEPSLSDHAQIFFELEAMVHLEPNWFRNPRKTDWAKYSAEIEETLSGLSGKIKDDKNLDKAANDFAESIIRAYENSCKQTEVRKAKDTYWWTGRLESLRKNTRRLFRRAKLKRTTEG